jgi:hypothetical protein
VGHSVKGQVSKRDCCYACGVVVGKRVEEFEAHARYEILVRRAPDPRMMLRNPVWARWCVADPRKHVEKLREFFFKKQNMPRGYDLVG